MYGPSVPWRGDASDLRETVSKCVPMDRDCHFGTIKISVTGPVYIGGSIPLKWLSNVLFPLTRCRKTRVCLFCTSKAISGKALEEDFEKAGLAVPVEFRFRYPDIAFGQVRFLLRRP